MTVSLDAMSFVERIADGHRPSIAQAISLLEARHPGFEELGEALWAAGGTARVIGITGAPGSGKSTLVNALTRELRVRGRRVGIVAVDPSSSISGGAILGDRIRMGEHTRDGNVYVRSLSNRGSLGGISRATFDAVTVLDAARFDDVIVETVGVGQAEVDIVRVAHSVLVVSVPGFGDDIQMIKAGLLELADIHVVNKADRPDVHKLVSEITSMLTLEPRPESGHWSPPVVETVALAAPSGIDALVDALNLHTDWLRSTGKLEERTRRAAEIRVREIAKELLVESLQDLSAEDTFQDAIASVTSRKRGPCVVAAELVRCFAVPS
jgi:LAO/AO transport system kinase